MVINFAKDKFKQNKLTNKIRAQIQHGNQLDVHVEIQDPGIES